MSESINGWKPPVIFDHGLHDSRIATQEDMDRLTRANAAMYQALSVSMRAMEEAKLIITGDAT